MIKFLKINKEKKLKWISYVLMISGFSLVLFSSFEFALINSGCFGGGGYDDDGLLTFFFLLIGIAGILIYKRNSLFQVPLIITIIGILFNILLNLYYHLFSEVFIFKPTLVACILLLILKDKDFDF